MVKEIISEGTKKLKEGIERDIHYLVIKYLLEKGSLEDSETLNNKEIGELAPYLYMHKYYIDSMKRNEIETNVLLGEVFLAIDIWKAFAKSLDSWGSVFESIDYIAANSKILMDKYKNRFLPNRIPESFKGEIFGEIYCGFEKPQVMAMIVSEYKLAKH